MILPNIPTAKFNSSYYYVFYVIIAAVFFYGGLQHDFIFDDVVMISQNQALRLDLIGKYFFSFIGDSANSFVGYRPMVWASLAIEKYLFGNVPLHFRVSNLCVHTLNACFVFNILKFKIKAQDQRLIIFFSALLFLVHPINANVIQLIWKRSDLFVTLGIFVSIFSLQHRKYICVFFGALFALLSKENAIVLVPTLILARLCLCNVSKKETWNEWQKWLLPASLLTLAHAWVCFSIWPKVISEFGLPSETFTPSFFLLKRYDYAMLQLASFPEYVRLAFFPTGLTVFHFIRPVQSFLEFSFILGGALLNGLIVLAIMDYKKTGILFFCSAWFILHLAPTSSFFPLNLPFDEDRLYLPLFSLCVGMSYLFGKLANKQKMGGYLFLLLCSLFFSFQLTRTLTHWRSPVALWIHNIKVYPEDPRPWLALGMAESIAHPKEALNFMEQALRLDPSYPVAPFFLGMAEMKVKQWPQAKKHFELSIRNKAFEAESLMNLGSIYANLKDEKNALVFFDRSIAQKPALVECYRNKARLLVNLGRLQDALQTLRAAILIDSKDVTTLKQALQILIDLKTPESQLQPLYKELKEATLS